MSTTQLSPVLRQRFFDANGVPLAGGLLYSYIAGTSTPKATYTDETGGTANPNPVVLDSQGYAEVWLALDNTAYKFALHDANDVPQWTVDEVLPTQANIFSEIQFQNGGAGPIYTLKPPTPIQASPVQNVVLPTIPAVPSFVAMDSTGNLLAEFPTSKGLINSMLADHTIDPTTKIISGYQIPIVTSTKTFASHPDPAFTEGEILADTGGGAFGFTLPLITTCPGFTIRIKKISNDFNPLTVGANSTDTIDGGTTIKLNIQEESVTLVNDGVGNWNILSRYYPQNWISGTFTASGGFGTISRQDTFMRRQGDSLQARVNLQFSATSAAIPYIGLPTGLSLDISKLVASQTPLGTAWGLNLSDTYVASPGRVFPVFYDGTGITISGTGTGGNFLTLTANSFIGGTQGIAFDILVPILNWAG